MISRYNKRNKFFLGKTMVYCFLSGWALTTIYPLYWVLLNSFKTSYEIILNSFNIPGEFKILNYINAFMKINIGRSYLNSLIISCSVVAIVIFLGGLAAYVLGRFEFKFKKAIHTALMGSLLFPAFCTIVPVFVMLKNFHLLNKHLGLILPQAAGNLPFAIIVLTGFMISIPREFEESALIEGCSVWQVYIKIIAPVSRSAFASVAIFTFLWSYNDLFMSLIILRTREVQPINVLLAEISSQYGTDYGLMAAAIVIIIIPVLAFYLAAQKSIVKGLTAGALKG